MALRDTMFKDKWVKVYVPIRNIPSLKQAARQMNIEFVDGEQDETQRGISFLICTYSQLVLIGGLAGVDSSFNQIKNIIPDVDKLG